MSLGGGHKNGNERRVAGRWQASTRFANPRYSNGQRWGALAVLVSGAEGPAFESRLAHQTPRGFSFGRLRRPRWPAARIPPGAFPLITLVRLFSVLSGRACAESALSGRGNGSLTADTPHDPVRRSRGLIARSRRGRGLKAFN